MGWYVRALTLVLIATLISFPGWASQTETAGVFRYHIPAEPQSLDASRLTSTDASYFFNNIMRGLYSYSNQTGLVAEGAKSCQFETPLRLICVLDTNVRWSDGSKVVAEDYVRSFQRLVAVTGKNPSVELLKNVVGAMAINSGKQQKLSELGVRAVDSSHLRIDFEKPDPDFLFKLTASVLTPASPKAPTGKVLKRGEIDSLVFNGPYKVTAWTLGRRLHLESNPYYTRGNAGRPPVEVLFIDDDQTALQLYDKRTLTFLRRLPTIFIPKYRDKPDFVQVPVARFDYVGFGDELRNQPDFRRALSLAADYRELAKIYDALGIPGCPSLPENMLDKERCVVFDLSAAQKAWAKVPSDLKTRHYKLAFSRLGGDDVKKGMEWFQAQWKKNLGLTIDLEQNEQGAYLEMLRTEPPAIFRKGIGLERPTCLAALENFAPGGSENFLKIEDPSYAGIVDQLRASSEASPPEMGQNARPGSKDKLEQKRLCGAGVQWLTDRSLLIPLGRIHFTILADPHFTGWTLNEMNQLDLSSLKYQPTSD